ncbi:hypothetical protein [Arenimonas alkanexedens]
MIWLLVNAWWMLPALVAIPALIVLFGAGGPLALRSLAKRVPAPVWQGLAVVLAVSLASSWLIGIGEGRCQAAQVKAEAKADKRASAVADKTAAASDEARKTIRKESQDAVTEVRTIVRTLPATCPAQPERMSELGRAAVEAASRELLATP